MIGPAHPPPPPSARPSGRPGSFERRFRAILLAVVLLSVLAFGVSEGDAALTITLMSAAIVGWLVTETGARRGVPRWATVLVLIGILIGAIVRSVQGTPMVSAFSTFLASIIVLKLWERREMRDYGQLLTLSLFLVIGAALTATTVWIGATLLVLTPLIALAVMMYQVYSARERAKPAWADSDRFGPLSWERTGRGLGWTTAFVVAAASGIGVVVFIIVPRGEGFQSFTPLGVSMAGRQTGFTDRVDLGMGGLISESQATVMEVELRSGVNGPRTGGPGQRQYLRGLVLDDYLRGVWTRGASGGSWQHEERDAGQMLRIEPRPRDPTSMTTQIVTLREPARSAAPVFALGRIVEVEFVPPHRELGPRVEFEIDRASGCVTHREDSSYRAQYRVVSRVESGIRDDIAWVREPTVVESARISALARSLLEDAGIESDPLFRDATLDARAARVFESHLRTACTYTLSPDAAPAEKDPTEWFLMTSRRGHCEHFASGLVALCRSVGIEARVVAGYLASEFDEERGLYVVRESNAHAWVEVRTGADRWTVFDATPPAELERILSEQRGWSGLLGRLSDSLENLWNSRVAMFDSQAQSRLFGRGPGPRGWSENALHWLRAQWADTDAGRPRSSRPWLIGAGVLGGLGGAWLLLYLARSRREALRARAWGVSGEAARLHRELDRAIERRRGRRPVWIPLARWAASEGTEVQRAAEAVYAWAFGGVAPSSAVRARIQRTLRLLRA